MDDLANRSGLLGLSGVSGDVRDLEQAAAEGNDRARLALEVFPTKFAAILGGLLVELGGLDVIVFTGGIGENGSTIRTLVCENLEDLGIALDARSPMRSAKGECQDQQPDDSPAQIWIVPTNEEIVVARQARQLLGGIRACSSPRSPVHWLRRRRSNDGRL